MSDRKRALRDRLAKRAKEQAIELIRDLKQRNGATGRSIARELDLSEQRVQYILQGRGGQLRLDTLSKLLSAIGPGYELKLTAVPIGDGIES